MLRNVIAIIPARYDAKRLPGKPLAMIGDTSLIMRVYDRVSLSGLFSKVIVATDDKRVLEHVEENGGQAVMTSSQHPNGTSRCVEALDLIEGSSQSRFDLVVNVQGDEPFVEIGDLELLINSFDRPGPSIATLATPVKNTEQLRDPNSVKVVISDIDHALYFSRAAIPYQRDLPVEEWLASTEYFSHLGVYAFTATALRELTELPPSAAEMAESLEQLRWMSAGYHIRVVKTDTEGFGIDTPEDLIEAERRVSSGA